jgi:hypothetical protein
MEPVKPRELHTAARVADALVYAAGVAGIVAGGLLFRADEIGFAIVAWTLAFVAGATLRLASWCARALAQLLVRADQIHEELDDLRRAGPPPPSARDDGPPDPYRRWGGGGSGWH